MPLLSLEAIQDGFHSDPSFYPQALDLARDAILVLRLDEATFRAASFLDDRIFTPQSLGRWVRLGELPALSPPKSPARPLHFIFHTGHVGSTLVSRLLDEVEGVLSLREPLPLRTLAGALGEVDAPSALVDAAGWRGLLELHLTCWGRGYPQTRAVVVKATSSASPCGAPILAALPEARALLLNLQPETYIATLLAGENSWLDLRALAQERMKRLLQQAPSCTPALHTLGLGEIAAMTWAVETLTHRAAEERGGPRAMRLDFDAFLQNPAVAMRAVCTHFELDAPEAYFAGLDASPALTRYSKAPEHAYSPALRRQILAESRARNAAEIRKGMAWLDTARTREPALAEALSA